MARQRRYNPRPTLSVLCSGIENIVQGQSLLPRLQHLLGILSYAQINEESATRFVNPLDYYFCFKCRDETWEGVIARSL